MLLVSLLLNAQPTFAGVSASSGTYPNDPPAVASPPGAVASPQDRQDAGPAFLTEDLSPALQKALAELEGRRQEVAALRLAVGVRDDKIRILEGIVAQQTELVERWKTAALERADVNALDAKIEASYRDSVARYSVELARVRQDRDKQASLKKFWAIGGFVLGVVVTVIATKD
ncbi:MAG: hypothetical protein IT336_15095 [Thermomicrobiales bacterium]|nr:hypothetical protein [Thermomicrobiales bacterium]